MYYWSGGIIFFALAVLLVVAFVRVKRRDREYGEGKASHHEPESHGRTTPKKDHHS